MWHEVLSKLRKEKTVRSDALRRQSSITSCIALNNMALCPGLSSVCSLLQHGQWASSLKSVHRRSWSAAGKRPESNGFRLHRFSTESWQEEERDTVLRVQMADSQCKCSEHYYLQYCLFWSWIKFEMTEKRMEKCVIQQKSWLSKKIHAF